MSTDIWRHTVMSITDRIFPPISPDQHIGPTFVTEIVSSLPLQMSLYFNVIYFPFWLCTFVSLIWLKLECLNMLIQTILMVSLILIFLLECARLYLGVHGNLKEKIPDLAAFWMFSLILQLPLQTLFFVLNSSPVEMAVQGIMYFMLLVELIFGFIVLRDMAKHHKLRFHLSQFYDGQHCKTE
ncbi:transmembrane protein 17B-like [Daktulosphaira vitifoliae]|uniref:transmembrane protein 17B-like n=1 Tax=Daktulosphaira vitifoliae TaxID=58002 RepID=UPI0021AB09F2|nr:transmembrane protein 17B-like [Daktulosphaira vitifoliae]XP_050541069.1 transmembrane protein 17B-like [Daktulosphaira vitifoliae]